jgi:hypothetical protein
VLDGRKAAPDERNGEQAPFETLRQSLSHELPQLRESPFGLASCRKQTLGAFKETCPEICAASEHSTTAGGSRSHRRFSLPAGRSKSPTGDEGRKRGASMEHQYRDAYRDPHRRDRGIAAAPGIVVARFSELGTSFQQRFL